MPRGALDFDPANLGPFRESWEDKRDLRGPALVKANLRTVFLKNMPRQMRDLLRLHTLEPTDLVLGDATSLGPALLHERPRGARPHCAPPGLGATSGAK